MEELDDSYRDYLLRKGYYEREFEELSEIGDGALESVFKVKKKSDTKIYAVKKIRLRPGSKFPQELKFSPIFADIYDDEKRVTEYFDMWIEKNLIINYIDECNDSFESFFTVYVLMDFCEETLEEIIKEIKNDKNLRENGMLAPLGYYIASEIFIEIFGAVKRLHEKVPQIIHRDLKPSNVLLTNGIKAKLVRIADFGLSTIHEFEDQTHTLDVGTCKYMAPEVINMKNYDSKADIYALGICLIEIFAIDINRNYEENDENHPSILMEKYKEISDLSERMTRGRSKERPNCQEILSIKHLWAMSLNELEDLIQIESIINSWDKINNSFIYQMITYKRIEDYITLFNENFFRHMYYANEFEEICILGKGDYGCVYKAKAVDNDDELFAIKRIEFILKKQKQFMKELKTSSVITKLDNERLVKYYDVWLENSHNTTENKIEHVTLYIQMELCDNKTLKDMIEEMKNDPYFLKKNQDDDNLSLLGYYLTNEIFEEILEGFSYLHERKIIHRDLKPDNILFKQSSISDKFVKIADFGLITILEAKKKAELEQQKIDQQLNAIELELAEETHTANMGAREYAAPEKISGANYDHRVDIYSLGIILKEIFFIDINRDYISDILKHSELLMRKYQELSDLSYKMTRRRVNDRAQNIDEVLKDKHLWGLKKVEKLGDEKFEAKEEFEIILKMKKHQNSIEPYIYSMLRKKLL